MLRFRGAELRPVLVEAKERGCRVILVKDQGVYMMSEFGERTPEGRQKILAYAIGCNPDVDPFDDWWDLAKAELGGDDFGEYFDADAAPFPAILESGDDLTVRATKTHLYLAAATPLRQQ